MQLQIKMKFSNKLLNWQKINQKNLEIQKKFKKLIKLNKSKNYNQS